MYQPRGCADSLASLFTSLALLVLALSLLIVLAAIFAVAAAIVLFLRFLIRRYVMPQLYPATAVFAERRLFGAPPDSQWFSAFDYWLWCLEKATGLKFTESPGQIFAGSIIISLSPALVAGLPLALLTGSDAWLWGFGLTGLLIGSVTGHRMGQPAEGWFGSLQGGAPQNVESGGIGLGEEEW